MDVDYVEGTYFHGTGDGGGFDIFGDGYAWRVRG